MTLYAHRVSLIHTENAFKVGPCIREVEGAGHTVIRFNVGEPDFATPAHIRDEIKRQLDLDNTHYSDPQGIAALREAIAERLSRTRDLSVGADQVVVFPGGKPPIGLSQLVYCQSGDEIVYPSPGFPIYESFTEFVGARPVPLHLKEEQGFAFTGAELAELINERTKLIIMNFPSNPTGGVATAEQLESIARVIRERCSPDVRIYSDEIYEDFTFDGQAHRSIASLPGMAERTIIASGASKAYSFTGGRVGWAAFPSAAEAQVFTNMNINFFTCLSPYTMHGALAALTDPRSEPAIEEMRGAFERRRDIVVAALNAIDGVSCQSPGGAFYVFPNVSGLCEQLGACEAFEELPDEARAQSSPSTLLQMFLLYSHHVAVLDRRSFGRIGTEGKHFLRLSIASSEAELEEGVARIARAAKDPDGFARYLSEGGRTS